MNAQVTKLSRIIFLVGLLFPFNPVYGDGHWLDLPPDLLVEILYQYDPKLDQLNTLVQEYHAIDKKTWNTFPQRIMYLDKIALHSKELSSQVENEYLRRISIKYSTLASKKKLYLQSLQKTKVNYANIKNNVYNLNVIPAKYTPLKLNNERKLDFKTQEFWGQYFIEAVDPCHRRLMISYYEIWKKKYPNKELPDFFLWLEDKNVSLFFPSITLLTQKELKALKVIIKGGKFYSSNNKLITTPNVDNTSIFKSEPIFIINSNECMYITNSGSQHAHVSLSHYKPLIGSGKIWLDKGTIKKISFESGHYLPQIPHYIQTLNFWQEKGVKIEENVELVYYEGYEEKQTTFGEFKKIYLLPQKNVSH